MLATHRGLAVCLTILSIAAFAQAEDFSSPPNTDPRGLDADGTYAQPNIRLADGSLAYVHVRPSDMPWRISIGYPKRPSKYASRKKTRLVAIEAMQMWEKAIQPHLPWFRLEFVEDDPSAPVQIQWKRRIAGPYWGFGRIQYWVNDQVIRVGGEMQLSTTPATFTTLSIDQVRLLVAHEFGHVLGLGHCLECDSAMNYAWHTRERVLVTEVDVRSFRKLVAQPVLGRPDVAPVAAAAKNEESTQLQATEANPQAAGEVPVPPPALTAEEQRAAWQERMNERLFVFENGGWRVVEGWRRRMGPKEGEVWVTYDEMREMKRTGQVPEGADD